MTQFANLAPPSPRSLASEQPHRDTTPSVGQTNPKLDGIDVSRFQPVPSASDAHSVAPSPGPLTPGAWSEAELASMDLTRRVKKNSTIHSKSGGFSDVYIGTLQPEGLKVGPQGGLAKSESNGPRHRSLSRLLEQPIWGILKQSRKRGASG